MYEILRNLIIKISLEIGKEEVISKCFQIVLDYWTHFNGSIKIMVLKFLKVNIFRISDHTSKFSYYLRISIKTG